MINDMDKLDLLKEKMTKFYNEGCEKYYYNSDDVYGCEKCPFNKECKSILYAYMPIGIINVINRYKSYI